MVSPLDASVEGARAVESSVVEISSGDGEATAESVGLPVAGSTSFRSG